MDMLIQAMTGDNPEQPVGQDNRQKNRARSRDISVCTNDQAASIYRHNRPSGSTTHRDPLDSLPAPGALRREENLDGEIDYLLAREDFRPVSNSGKPSHLVNDVGISKPYMFMEREGLETVKQKLEARNSMSALEYINASLLLLQDKSAYEPRDRELILKHILAVSTDALAGPWPDVRRWSQYIWDQVDKGRCTWDNTAMIQDERIRISYTNGSVSQIATGVSAQHKPQQPSTSPMSLAVCREFNAPSGCRFTGSHDLGQVRYIHSCAFCDSMGRKSPHSFQKCRLKQENGNSNQSAQENRQWHQPHQSSNRNNGSMFVSSKNG